MIMNDNLKRLIDALKNGNYVQTIGQLRKKDNTPHALLLNPDSIPFIGSYCWAGVACDLCDSSKWDGEEYEKNNLWVMPESVQSFYGFKSPIGAFIGDPFSFESLSEMNDGGCDFAQIADTIQWGWENNGYSEMFVVDQ
jgi:hypothetical protein